MSYDNKPYDDFYVPGQEEDCYGKSSQKGKAGVNILIIVFTMIAGFVAWYIGTAVYASNQYTMAMPLLMGIIFVILYAVLTIAVLLFSAATGSYKGNVALFGQSSSGNALLTILALGVTLFACSALFQWIYSLNFAQNKLQATSFVFLIDDSGSMEASDPYKKRYEAVKTVLKNVGNKFPFAVYSFSDDVQLIREMAPVSEGIPNFKGNSWGGTSIKGALSRAIEDRENGTWDGGSSPKVILLTDGYATDLDIFNNINSVLQKYVKSKITVCTIGLGSVDETLMNQIANTTGGVYIDVDDADKLGDAMTSAVVQYSPRDLLSVRYVKSLNFLYGLLRVLFIIVLACIIGIGVSLAYGVRGTSTIVLQYSVIKAILGGILMEGGVEILGLSDRFTWLLLWLLLALTIVPKKKTERVQNGSVGGGHHIGGGYGYESGSSDFGSNSGYSGGNNGSDF